MPCKSERYAFTKEPSAKDSDKKSKYKFKFTGYIIARKLYDDDGKLKPFSYYPRREHSKPPYWYRTKPQALKALNRMKKYNRFPGNQSNSTVVKFTRNTYLDRY